MLLLSNMRLKVNPMKSRHLDELMSTFSLLIVMIWTLWITVVAFTDSADFLKVLHLLPTTFRAASGNFELVLSFLKYHHLASLPLAYGVYTLIILWALLIAAAHWRAVISFLKMNHNTFIKQRLLFFKHKHGGFVPRDR